MYVKTGLKETPRTTGPRVFVFSYSVACRPFNLSVHTETAAA